jgi:hypothetical protein
MVMWTTEADFHDELYRSYKDAKLTDYAVPGHALGSVVWAVRESEEIIIPQSTKRGLSIVDYLLSDAIFWVAAFHMTLIANNGEKATPLFRTIFALTLKVTQDSVVVRDLIVRGYDLQARNLVRSIGEHIDAIYYLCLHPEACDEFVRTEDEEGANQFWHRHLKKARGAIDKKLMQMIETPNASIIEKFSEFRRQEGETFSAAHHPSFWVCLASQYIPNSSGNIFFNMFGIPSDYSFRTGKYLFYSLAECAVLMPIFCKPIGDHILSLEELDPFRVYVRRGVPHLISMIFAVIENWDAQPTLQTAPWKLADASCPALGRASCFGRHRRANIIGMAGTGPAMTNRCAVRTSE